MKDIAIETVDTQTVQTAREWFFPVMDWYGQGTSWFIGQASNTALEAEMQIRNSAYPVKQARILRVILPCQVIP